MARSPNEHTTLEARAGTWRGPSALRSDDRSSPRLPDPNPAQSSARSATERVASASGGTPNLAAAGYQIHGTLGEGGLGVVYEALCTRTQQRVAIKVARPGVVDALRREIRILENLRHPGIVRFIDKGEVDGAAFFVMELVTGPSLADHLAARPESGADATLLVRMRTIAARSARSRQRSQRRNNSRVCPREMPRSRAGSTSSVSLTIARATSSAVNCT
jgi:serine/threonine protein kinase